MFRLTLLLPLAFGLNGCNDETLTAYGAGDTVWTLQSIDDKPFTAKATISFPKEGQITGNAPCNSYSASQSAPYPWFEVGQITSTKRACPDLEAENTFLKALPQMTISEVSATTLILSNDAKRTMIFAPD